MNRAAGCLNRLLKRPLACGLLGLALARSASGQQALYDNENYYAPTALAIPSIDATNFLNNGTFTINFPTSTRIQLFETSDTLNYTNNGLMTCNNGFQFDTHSSSSGLHSMASTFFNPGTIRCGSSIDGVFPVDGVPPEMFVSATNIVNPGTVIVGQTAVLTGESGTTITAEEANGLLQFSGQNIDLTRAILSVETTFSITGSGGSGFDTNKDWYPSLYLTPTEAISSLSAPIAAIFPPYAQLVLTNSTPYFVQTGVGTSNVITKMIFIQNNNPIPYNVYLNNNFNQASVGFGEATIEWLGSSLDSASGNTVSSYLYLNDDYVQGSVTNVPQINGIPDNFTVTESPVQLTGIGNLQSSGYPAGLILPANTVVSNTYSYATVQLIPTSVSTNSVANGALTNIPGRIQINASKELNLSLASLSGLNYMSLASTNQFDGSPGAQIYSPYSDINIGVTNGFLTVSNLTEANIPLWNGTIQCWSGRWIYVDPTGVTNDFRVLLVGSQLLPTTAAQAQDLILHGSNSVVISDAFSIMRKLSIDSQNVTLTTNVVGGGAESLDGELNVETPLIYWSNSVPNVRNLTNNGAIRLQNFTTFGTAQTNYYNFINNGAVVDQGAQIWANNFTSSGTFTNGAGPFTLKSTNTAFANQILNTASNDVSITTGSMVASNLVMQAGRSLTITATNLLTDGGVNSSNYWTVGAVAINNGTGLSLPIKPAFGDLLGTTITNIAPTNKNVAVVWSGNDYGSTTAGFTNNAAVGRLILDAYQTSPQNGVFSFKGAGTSNAMYVDYLEFRDSATNEANYNMNALSIGTNITIYFAQAMLNGVSIAEKIDKASRFGNGVSNYNGGRLIWVPSYAGNFSSTNFVYPGGVTNTVNAALASSTDIDSDGDVIANAYDSTPFFLASQVNFTETLTNVPPLSVNLTWATVPLGTNYVYYKTNLLSTNWVLLTNATLTANPFPSPQPYPSSVTNVSVLDPVNFMQPRYYRIVVQPYLTGPYGY
jgi:hypothetical protein